MSAVSIPEVKGVLRATTLWELERLVERVLQLPTAGEIRDAVTEYLDELGVQIGGPR
jgi:signal transduction protein with GAF and PtsI domain